MAISGMNTFCKTSAYPSLPYRVMGPNPSYQWTNRPVWPTGVLCGSEISGDRSEISGDLEVQWKGYPCGRLRQECRVRYQTKRPWVLHKKGGINAQCMDLRDPMSGDSGSQEEHLKCQILGHGLMQRLKRLFNECRQNHQKIPPGNQGSSRWILSPVTKHPPSH